MYLALDSRSREKGLEMKRYGLVLTLALVLALALPALADPLPVLAEPGLALMAVTNTTATLRVTGGAAYGTPNGFTVQWIPVPAGWNGVWPEAGAKQAVYLGHGVAGSPFVLLPLGTVDIVLGAKDLRPTVGYDPANSVAALQPNNQYAVRIVANSLPAAYLQGAWSAPVLLTTAETGPDDEQEENERRGKGYWKNHEDWPAALGVDYANWFGTGRSWTEILNTPPKKGDTYYMLAHKYIAAKLNVLAGHLPPAEVTAAIATAEAYFATAAPGVRANTAQGKVNLKLAAVLASWGAAEDGPEALDLDDLDEPRGGPPAGRGGPPEGRGQSEDKGGPPANRGKGNGKKPK
jgi:hypothetical protein